MDQFGAAGLYNASPTHPERERILNLAGRTRRRAGTPPADWPVPFAGDDVARMPTVLALVSDLGFEAIDVGPLAVARLLEPMAMLWIHMTLYRGAPMTQAFALTHRP